ncbi:MAG: hypothetical protein ACOYXU_09285 [Nitrospirota bacterium]
MKTNPLRDTKTTTIPAWVMVSALAAAFVLTPVAEAAAADVAGTFSKGRSRFSIVGGNGYAFNDTYFVLGVGASYFVYNGLSVGLDAEWWTGGDPGIVKVSPSLQYVFTDLASVAPYIGAFYRRSYVQDLDDIGSAGGRAGVYITAGRTTYVGLGMVYESYFDCNESTYVSCSETYPEISFSVAF